MFSQVGTVGSLDKLDIEDGVDSSRKRGPYLSNQVDVVRLLNPEITIALAIGEHMVGQHNVKAVWKDSEAQRPRMKSDSGRSL